MKRLKHFFIAATALFLTIGLDAQILTFDHGTVEFYTASVITDIAAVSEEAEVSVNTETGDVSVQIEIESFEFDYNLMKNHFNEQHMESEQYPHAVFQGTIAEDISAIEGEQEVDVTGEITIHGVTKELELKVNVSNEGEFKVVEFSFPVIFADYNIEEPTILTRPVAEEVEVESVFYLK